MKKKTQSREVVILSPKGIILEAHNANKRVGFFDTLAPSDQQYITDVSDEILATPGTPVTVVARIVIRELNLPCSTHTMVRILKGLMNEKQ